jgi:hypothetical protein
MSVACSWLYDFLFLLYSSFQMLNFDRGGLVAAAPNPPVATPILKILLK